MFLAVGIISLFMWKVLRADWVVECDYASADFHPPVSVESYKAKFYPHVTPIWSPPTPQGIAGRQNAKWSDHEFFDAGGSYGPTNEPELHLNWPLIIAKMFAGVFLVSFTVFRITSSKP